MSTINQFYNNLGQSDIKQKYLQIQNLKLSNNHFQVKDNSLKKLSDNELLSKIKILAQKQRNLNIVIINYLEEIELRKLHYKKGFSSLFEYAVKDLKMSEGAVCRRIKAMRLCKAMPTAKQSIISGDLSLSVASQLQSFFEKHNRKVRMEKEVKKQGLLLNRLSNDNQKSNKINEIHTTESTFNAKSEKSLKVDKLETKNNLIEQREQKETKALDMSQKRDLLKQCEQSSTRKTARILESIDPEIATIKEKVRYVGESKVEIKIVIAENIQKDLESLKQLLSHKNPNMSYAELLSILINLGLKKYDPSLKESRSIKKNKGHKSIGGGSAPKCEVNQNAGGGSAAECEVNKSNSLNYDKSQEIKPSVKKISRYIPASVKQYIWKRDKGQCSYVSASGKKCESKHLLQIDHIKPFALGGENTKDNLRLLCAGHNQCRMQDTFHFRHK